MMAAWLALILIPAVALATCWAYLAGKNRAVRDDLEKERHVVASAGRVRDRLRGHAAYAERVRKRFTR